MIDHVTLRKLDQLDARVAKLEGKLTRSFADAEPGTEGRAEGSAGQTAGAPPRGVTTLDGALASVRGEQEDAEVRLKRLEARIVALETARR